MYSPCIREANEACCHGCCPAPFLNLVDPQSSTQKSTSSVAASWYEFTAATVSSLYPNTQFTNHESIISLDESFSKFIKAYPQYSQTNQADRIRAKEYYHLSVSSQVCLDYIGHCLFSYSQIKRSDTSVSIASSSISPPPLLQFDASESPFFDISHRSVNFNLQILLDGKEPGLESNIRKRIMAYLNISEDDYSMIITANQSSAFKLLADTYPFHSNRNLLTVYDYESEAVSTMIESSKNRGARVFSAKFSWPNLRIVSKKLRDTIVNKRKKRKRGLFVFPLQSRMTGTRYSYLWMSLAHENGWHVLLDASALGPKDTDTLGLSLFQPDFLICSFYKVFGENPSGFGCLFVKKSSASVLEDSTTGSVGIVKLVPPTMPPKYPTGLVISDKLNEQETDESDVKQKRPLSSEIVELGEPTQFKGKKTNFTGSSEIEYRGLDRADSLNGSSEIECRGLDHADSLGLILISNRARYLVNWLVNALMSLQHPNSETRLSLVRIYGPKIKFDRGPFLAFNVFDWRGEKIDPSLVQKLADRNNISLSYGFLHHVWFSDKCQEETERILEKTTNVEEITVRNKRERSHLGIPVVTAALSFLTTFEDTYRLWAFISRFLDADFLEKERWRYMALNQKAVEI